MNEEKRYKSYLGKGTYLPRELILSKAYRNLTKTASDVLLIFWLKQRKEKVNCKGKGKRKDEYVTTNNSEIEFTYPEAKQRFGLSIMQFTRARDLLVKMGFIDISSSGSGMFKQANKYSISERWRKYGTNEFVEKRREPDRRYIGFRGSKRKRENKIN